MTPETIKLMTAVIQLQTAITNQQKQKEISYNKFKNLEIELDDLQNQLTENLKELLIKLNA
jgi:NADH:ubiquinone oxidoreductase subunit B-like Fe-S oxidoreductase